MRSRRRTASSPTRPLRTSTRPARKPIRAASGSGTQAIGQSAESEQDAVAASKAEQSGAKNTNISVRVLSPGDDGSVDQSNSVKSSATAANLNLTEQDAGQAQGGSGGTQAIGQTREVRPVGGRTVRRRAERREQHQHPGARSQHGRRRRRHAVEQRRLVRDRGEPERDQAGRGSDAGGRGDAAARPAASRRSARSRRTSRPHWRCRRRCSHGASNRTRRFASPATATTATSPVEQRRVRRDGAERQPDRPACGSGPAGRQLPLRVRRDPGDRPGRDERAGCSRRVAGRPVGRPRPVWLRRRREHERARAGRQRRRRWLGRPVEQRRFVCDGGEPERDWTRARLRVRVPARRHRRRSARRPRTTRRRLGCRRRCSTAPRTATRRCGSTARVTAATSRSRTTSARTRPR